MTVETRWEGTPCAVREESIGPIFGVADFGQAARPRAGRVLSPTLLNS